MYERVKNFLIVIVVFSILSFQTNLAAFAQTFKTDRVFGADRYDTAVSISQKGWQNGSKYAVIARGDDFADALCAGPLAKKYDAPILLTESQDLNNSTLYELKRLKAEDVIIVGGLSAVSQKVEDKIKSIGTINVERIWGADRFETSVKIAERLGAAGDIVLATGLNFPDALSISPIASNLGMPILLVEKDNIPAKVDDYIKQQNISKAYVIGGTGVISDDAVKGISGSIRLGGKDRYETNALVLSHFADKLDFSNIYIAVADGPSGDEFADALSGSVLAAKISSPVILIYKTLSDALSSFLKQKLKADANVWALGGENAVSNSALNSVSSLLNDQQTVPQGGSSTDQAQVDTSSFYFNVVIYNHPEITFTPIHSGYSIDLSALDDLLHVYGFNLSSNVKCQFKITNITNEDGLALGQEYLNDIAPIDIEPGETKFIKLDDLIKGTHNNDGVSLLYLRIYGKEAALKGTVTTDDGKKTDVQATLILSR